MTKSKDKSSMEFAAISLMLIELILKYGPSIAVRIIQTLEPSDITPEKIRALLVKNPKTYYFDEVK